MGSFFHIYGVFSKISAGDSTAEQLPKLPTLPNFKCNALPDTPEYRIYMAQLRKQKEDFAREMTEYAAKMERIYKRGGDHIVTNSTQSYRIKSFGFLISTWVSTDTLNIKVKFSEPKTKTSVILKRCRKRFFRMETIGPDYAVTKWLFIKTPWKYYAKDLELVKNLEEDDGSIIIRGPVVKATTCHL
ncbi:unnamed protein product [Allacma fusca]|uniref:Uncharacterized protein n=1 Tax=Allacma fusca TaxID=39272 RepID=A0A8J2K800_9HEXA|nr:unnamed protein product [Allacma fusca]